MGWNLDTMDGDQWWSTGADSAGCCLSQRQVRARRRREVLVYAGPALPAAIQAERDRAADEGLTAALAERGIRRLSTPEAIAEWLDAQD